MIIEMFSRKRPGVKVSPLVSEDGELYVISGKTRYYDLVARGLVYGGETAVAGVAPGTVVGTTSPITLFNPTTSKKKLVVLKTSLGYLSGTLGAGAILYVVNISPKAADVTGTAIVVVNLLLGNARNDGGNVGQLFTTATLPATPTIIRPAFNLDASLATSVVGREKLVDEVDGEFQLLPGTALSMEGVAAAGTTPLVLLGMVWAEIPLDAD